MIKKIVNLTLLSLLFLNTPLLADDKIDLGIINFTEVKKDFYRGGQPTSDGYKALKRLKIKTVVNLRKDKTVDDERKWAHFEGMKFISIPMHAWEKPRSKDVDDFLRIASNPENFPLFVHCKHGVDRTGFMMAMYRMTQEEWSFEDAYQEMKQIGFHKNLFPNLKHELYRYALEWDRVSSRGIPWVDILFSPLTILRNILLENWYPFLALSPLRSP